MARRLPPGQLLLALLLLAVAAVVVWYRFDAMRGDSPPAVVDGEPVADVVAPIGAPDALQTSKWLAARAKRYRALFDGWQCDVLVAPLGVESLAFDRPTRYLMAGDIAQALAAPDKCVADPMLVDIALGEGLRQHSADAMRQLADDLKAKTLVSAWAGHDRRKQMRITLQVEQRDASGRTVSSKRKSFSANYSDDVSPFDAFHADLPRMLGEVGLSAAQRHVAAGELPDTLPASPTDAAKSSD